VRVIINDDVLARSGIRAGTFPSGQDGLRASDERGMAMFIMVALLIPLGLLVALFMDMGRLYALRGRMQVAADAAALAGASGFIDGTGTGDSVEARVAYYVAANPIAEVPATIDSLTIEPDSGTLSLVLSYHATPLLLAPAGIILRIGAKAKATLVTEGEIGRPIPQGNAYGWWKKDKTISAGHDSATVKLGS
jgi:hypothetical protein